LIKPEAVFEIESGLKLSAYDITRASAVRTEWYQAVRVFFRKYDYFIVPTAQLFPFDVDLHWPKEIAGRKMTTYHEWIEGRAAHHHGGMPGACGTRRLQRSGSADRYPRSQRRTTPKLACLQLAHAYDAATQWPARRLPALLAS